MKPAEQTQSSRFETHLRLKKLFLRALIVSLSTGALIAVGVLLFGQFNQTTNRILLTLGVLALHSGIAMACTEMLERRLWPALSRLGIIVFSLNFVLFVALIWSTSNDDTIGRELLTTLVLMGYYLVAIPPASLREKGRWPVLAYAGLIACFVGLGLALVTIWIEDLIDAVFARWAGVAAIVTCSIAHTCLLGRVRHCTANIWIVRGTIICIWVVAGIFSGAVLVDDLSEFAARLLGAAGVLDACGSLTLVILARLKGVGTIEHLQTSAKEIQLICPRCKKQQQVCAGHSKRAECGLKFRIEIEEPRCARCGYLLWQLTERRCPECGQTF